MSKRLQALAVLSEVLGSIPSTHVGAREQHLYWALLPSSALQEYMHMYMDTMFCIHIIKIINNYL